MSLYSPLLNLLPDLQKTIEGAFQTLRRVVFVVQESFTWGDFDPQISWSGMAATNVMVQRSRYLKIFNFLWFSLDFSATLAAPFTNNVVVTLPATVPAANSAHRGAQSAGCYVENNAVPEAGCWFIFGTTNKLLFLRTGSVNFSAGVGTFRANGFIEVIA